jgi:transposase
MLKKELLCIVEQHKSAYNLYVVDEMAKSANKTVLRIPPYHCELSAIELVWAQIKGYVAARNKTFRTREVKELLEEAVRKVSPDNWDKCVRHVF